MKNLDPTQQTKSCEEDARKLSPEVQGLIAQLYSYLEKNAYSESKPLPSTNQAISILKCKTRQICRKRQRSYS